MYTMRRIAKAAPLFLFLSATMTLVVDSDELTGDPIERQQTCKPNNTRTSKILARITREPNVQAYGLPRKVLPGDSRIEKICVERKSGLDGKVNEIRVIEDSEILTYDLPSRQLREKDDRVDGTSILDDSKKIEIDDQDLPELLTITTSRVRRPRCSGLCSFIASRWPIDTGSTAKEIQRMALIDTESGSRSKESDERAVP